MSWQICCWATHLLSLQSMWQIYQNASFISKSMLCYMLIRSWISKWFYRKDVELMNLEKEVGQNWCQVSLIRINQCVAGNQFPARARSSFKTMNSPPLLLRLLLLFYEILKKKNHYQVDFKERFLWLNLTFTFSSQSQVLIFTFVSDWNKPLSKEVMM